MKSRRMRKKRAKEVTLGEIKEALDTFGGRFDGVEGTLLKFGSRLDGVEGTLGNFGGRLGRLEETLGEIGEMVGFVVERMVTKEDLNEGLFELHTQVNNIESDIRAMKSVRVEVRVADLEEKVFGKAR